MASFLIRQAAIFVFLLSDFLIKTDAYVSDTKNSTVIVMAHNPFSSTTGKRHTELEFGP